MQFAKHCPLSCHPAQTTFSAKKLIQANCSWISEVRPVPRSSFCTEETWVGCELSVNSGLWVQLLLGVTEPKELSGLLGTECSWLNPLQQEDHESEHLPLQWSPCVLLCASQEERIYPCVLISTSPACNQTHPKRPLNICLSDCHLPTRPTHTWSRTGPSKGQPRVLYQIKFTHKKNPPPDWFPKARWSSCRR